MSARGTLYLAMRDYDRAIRDFDEAVRLNPQDVAAYTGRSIAHFQKGDYQRAIRDLDGSASAKIDICTAGDRRISVLALLN